MTERSATVAGLDACLRDAINDRASGIYFEGNDTTVVVRLRVDGVLHPLRELGEPRAVFEQLRTLAAIDLDTRIGDGRFVLALRGQRYELAVSVVTTAAGQSAQVFVIPQRGRYFPDFTFDALGLDGEDRARLEAAVARPGIVVLAGPTRSGKQPMLYASLLARADGSRKVFSVEWVLRDCLKGVDQVQVDDALGYGFPAYIRAAIRGSVDVLGVGELVDYETVEQTFRFVSRGKTAISTLHVSNAAGVFSRLINMGQEPYVVADLVSLVQAQRRVRLLCEECKVPAPHGRAGLADLGFTTEQIERARVFGPRGCARCHDRGYAGAALVVESLEVTPAIRERIMRRDFDGMRGPRTLREGALELAVAGKTTPTEALLAAG